MIDLEQYLQEQFNNFEYEIKISKSNTDDYDYQTQINKILMLKNKNNLEKYLDSNTKINSIFDYYFTGTNNNSFLSFKIKKKYIDDELKKFCKFLFFGENPDLNMNLIEKTKTPKKILYDYSSPNMAKDIHVGHLRSTVLGDLLANIAEYIGHNVTRINHLGDFGLPFGMIVEYIKKNNIEINEKTQLQELYVLAKNMFDNNKDFNSASYLRTAELQTESNENTVKIWKNVYEHSLKSYQTVYDLFNISKELKITGESFYVKYIDKVKNILNCNNLIEIDDKGRTIVNIGNINPLIYEKSEEKCNAYTYDTTDIVTLWYRTNILDQDEIYYVVDSGQSLHFKQLLELGKLMEWTKNKRVEHINFGIIKGKDGSKISSRIGNTPKLIDLVEDGIEYTVKSFEEKKSNMNIETIKKIAIGSIKYFDLSKCRTTNYVFDCNSMLRPDGNTYTYLSYSIARCRGILDNFNENGCIFSELIDLNQLEEIDYKLMRCILDFPSVLQQIMLTNMPHHFIGYLNKLISSLNENYTKKRCINFDKYGKIENFNECRIILYMYTMSLLKISCHLIGLPIVDKI